MSVTNDEEFGDALDGPRHAYLSLAGIATTAQWFGLPLDLRKRWWKETDYGRVLPSDELVAAIRAAIS